MKHIKSYNESQSWKDIHQDLEDICIELQDEGFTTTVYDKESVRIEPGQNPVCGSIKIYKYILRPISNTQFYQSFKYDDIREVIERIEDYLSSLKYNVEIFVISDKYPIKWLKYDDSFSLSCFTPISIDEIKFIYLRIINI